VFRENIPAQEAVLNHYIRLAVMTVLMFVAMFALMYAMVDKLDNVFPNLNQLYMAGLMTAPMVLIELALMWSMYKSRAANAAIVAISVIAFAVFWFGIRQQVAIADEQFLKSMIPHHAGAILMCGQAPVQDEEVKSLCQNIINSQQSEIEQMEAILGRLGRS
jgi:small-conductance mechanosensitive channel